MKSLKNLLIPFIIMVLLVVGVVVYYFVSRGNEEDVEEETSIDVLTVMSSDLYSVSCVSTIDSDLSTKVVKETDETGVGTVYTYAGGDIDENASYSQDTMSTYMSILTSYTSETLIESPESLAEYGLDNPAYTVTIETVSGMTYKVYLGNRTPDGTNCYMTYEGSGDVYTVKYAKIVYAEYKSIDFLDTQVLNIDYTLLDYVRFQRTTDGLDLKAVVTSNDSGTPSYKVIEPFEITSSTYFANLIEYIATLEITSYLEISDDELADYGLDEPTYTFEFAYNTGKKVVVHLSTNMAGYYYGYIDGMDEYFCASEYQIKLLDTPALNLIESYVVYVSSDEVSSIRGTYGDISFDFTMDVEEATAISDDTSTVKLDGRNAKIFNSDGRSYCAIFFESLVTIEIGGIDKDATPSGEEVCSLTYVLKDYSTKTLSFVQRDTDSYYMLIDGEYTSFYIYGRELFNNGGTDTYSYGVWEAYNLLTEAITNNLNGVYDIPTEEEA